MSKERKFETNISVLETAKSSKLANIEGNIKYDSNNHILTLAFPRGTYDFFGVEPEVVSNLISSDSVGSFIYKNIEGKYEYEKI